MLAVIVEFRLRAAHIEPFVRAVVDNARASRETEPGCRQFDVCRSRDDPGAVFLYELYDDEAAFRAHLETPHFQAFDRRVADWILDKKVQSWQRIAP